MEAIGSHGIWILKTPIDQWWGKYNAWIQRMQLWAIQVMVVGNKQSFLELWQQTEAVHEENYLQQRLIG